MNEAYLAVLMPGDTTSRLLQDPKAMTSMANTSIIIINYFIDRQTDFVQKLRHRVRKIHGLVFLYMSTGILVRQRCILRSVEFFFFFTAVPEVSKVTPG